MYDDKERYFQQIGFEDEIINAADYAYNVQRDLVSGFSQDYDNEQEIDWGEAEEDYDEVIKDPDECSREELIDMGAGLFEHDEDYIEVDKDGNKI